MAVGAGCTSLKTEVPQSAGVSADTTIFPDRLLAADFNAPKWESSLGGSFGSWDNDPGDPTHDCVVRLVEDPKVGDQGYALQINYDVDSPNPAFNGFWMKLPSIPSERYNAISFTLKGDDYGTFTKRFTIELKGHKNSASFVFDGTKPEWTRYHIPLESFEGYQKVKTIKEFVIIFDREMVTESEGILYLENIIFEI